MYLRLHMYSKELSSSSLLTLSKPKKEKKTPDKPLNCTLRSLSMQSINGLARAPVFALLCFYAAILFHCFMRIFYVNAIFSLIVFIKILFVIWIDCNRRLKIEVCMSNTKFYENDLETVHKNKQQQRKKHTVIDSWFTIFLVCFTVAVAKCVIIESHVAHILFCYSSKLAAERWQQNTKTNNEL